MGWKIIEVCESEHLNLFLNNLVIRKQDSKITIPIRDIDVLVLDNYCLKITLNLMIELAKNNVLVIVCNHQHLPFALQLPMIGNFNTLKILESQIHWSEEYKAKTWQNIIKQKIINQAELLALLNLDKDNYEKLLQLAGEIKLLDATNREGHAAKIYFHTLFGIEFKRTDDNNIINSFLNYGYSILLSYFSRSIVKKGLDLRISFFHCSFSNYYALACDLMEPFRFLIDLTVYRIIKSEDINFFRNKEKLIRLFNKKVLINGIKQFLNNAIDIYVDAIVNQSDLPIINLDDEWL